MADNLIDYSNLAAAGSAFKGFAEGFENAQDRKMKNMEREAQMRALDTRMQREKDQTDIENRRAAIQERTEAAKSAKEAQDASIAAYKQKLIVGPDGKVTPRTNYDPMEQAEAQRHDIVQGYNTKFGPSGEYLGTEVDPASLKAKQAEAKIAAEAQARSFREKSFDLRQQDSEKRNERQDKGLDLRNDVVDRREHERVLSRINANPNVKQRLTQYQNLDNALGIVTQSDNLTPQQIMEFQQAVRANLGIKGSSGVGEREETFFKTLGMKAENWKQFLTGDPAMISKDSNLIHHFQNLAKIEQQNISSQFDKSLGAAAGGHKSMYDRRPDLKEDLKDAMQLQKEQIAPSVAPQGLVSSAQGLVGQQGLVKGAPQAAPQDPNIAKYAQANGLDYTHAENILRARGYGK